MSLPVHPHTHLGKDKSSQEDFTILEAGIFIANTAGTKKAFSLLSQLKKKACRKSKRQQTKKLLKKKMYHLYCLMMIYRNVIYTSKAFS